MPLVPKFPGSEYAITSNEAFYLPSLPERVIVVGGGYIGVEFAGIFHGLGAQTTQIYRGEQFLRGFDDDIRKTLADEMRKRGIDLRFKSRITNIEKSGAVLKATLTDGNILEADQILFATGRGSKTPDLGLEKAGVKLKVNGAVIVDEYSKSTVDSVYAIGDCTDRMMLTPVAIAEGMALANTLFNNQPTMPCYLNVPTAVFSEPEVGVVGLTEAQAQAQVSTVDIYKTMFRPLKATLSGRDTTVLLKLVVDGRTNRVVGCHIVGPDAGEMVQLAAIAVKMGATKADFDATMAVHPTIAEELVTMRTVSKSYGREAAE